MSATDLVAVILSVASLFVVGLVVWLVVELRRTTEELRGTLERLRTNVDTTLAHVSSQARDVDAELHRVDGLLDAAERVSARADTLSRVTYGAVAKPVVRTAAVVRGASKAARRLRRGTDDNLERPAG